MSATILNRQVLVLNRNWVAIQLCTVRRALGLLCGELAEVVADDYETHNFESWLELSQYAQTDLIHTPSTQVAAPAVIKLIRYKGFPPRKARLSRRNIFLRDDMQCQYCGRAPRGDELTIDHVVPRSLGGRTTWDNVVLACARCNTRKGSKSPEQAGLVLARLPKEPNWLSCSRHWPPTNGAHTSAWQKFVDAAYWNVSLKE